MAGLLGSPCSAPGGGGKSAPSQPLDGRDKEGMDRSGSGAGKKLGLLLLDSCSSSGLGAAAAFFLDFLGAPSGLSALAPPCACCECSAHA